MSEYQGWTGKQRVRALRWLNAEYRAGRRVRPTVCDGCGQAEGVIEAHSEDYSEPFGPHIGGYGLCYRCHMALHCRVKAPEAWVLYRRAICAGVRFKPFLTRNWFGFRGQHLIRFSPETLDGLGPEREDVLGAATGSPPLPGMPPHRLRAIAAIPDHLIDTSDIPELPPCPATGRVCLDGCHVLTGGKWKHCARSDP